MKKNIKLKQRNKQKPKQNKIIKKNKKYMYLINIY